MKPITSLLCGMLCMCTTLFLSSCDLEQPDPEEQFKLRIYNQDVAHAELVHLSKLDTAKLTSEEELEKITREGDLLTLTSNIKVTGALYWATLEPGHARVPPGPGPTPCPIYLGCTETIAVSDLVLGVFKEDSLGAGDAARISSIPQPTATLQVDPDHVFAVGILTTPADPVFKTARFRFAVIDGKLKSKDLVLVITTSILQNGKVVPVEMKVPIPANSFTTD